MPHLRPRYASDRVKKLSSLWPLVGTNGPRQVGKTTLLEKQIKFNSIASFDDEAIVQDAENSAKDFIARLETPALIDEVQKVPKIFDALKLAVHKKRAPGSYFLTGSVSFSEGAGIRESLTGRIGLCRIYSMTLGEAKESPMPAAPKFSFTEKDKARFSAQDLSMHSQFGGMPIPMFLRDQTQRQLYWEGWLGTTLLKDLSRLFKRGFDSDFAMNIFDQFGKILKNGELPTLAHFSFKSSVKLKRYLLALESIFVVRKMTCHESGIGKDIWYVCDSGLAHYLTRFDRGEGSTLSLMRHSLLNEISALREYNNEPGIIQYFKSARGSEVEFVVEGVPIRVVPLADINSGSWGWYEKALIGAAKKLGSKQYIMASPVSRVHKDGNSLVVPWSIWS